MKSNHTPGPWRIGDKYQTDIYAARAGHAIARTVNPHYAGECEANARLIAAAPDLLQALQDLLILYQHKRPGVWGESLDQVKAAKAAIQKAIGAA